MNKQELENYQDLFFLGPKGEQRKFFQEMIEIVNTDMIFWRRNFHPKDPPTIPYRNLTSSIGLEFQGNFIQSLIELLAELKMDIPFFSPRYLAHMTADVSLPGLLGYYSGLLYNANNVSGEASPVTLKYELEVGQQFAHLFGYNKKESFGHIAGGGTVANFESIFYNKASRFIPATLGLIIKEEKMSWPSFLPDDLWKLLNIELSQIPNLLKEFNHLGFDWKKMMEKRSPAYLGDRQFWELLQNNFKTEIGSPVIIVPASAHYSWSKASHLFGIGRQHCLSVKLDENLAMCPLELDSILKFCHKEKRPIIQTVCVLGSTEFGSFDQLDLVLKTTQKWKDTNDLYTPVHIDGAYGGYFQTMFVAGERFPEIANMAKINNSRLYTIFEALPQTDSITVDPHKLGHTPTGAGVFVTKHGFSKEFVAEDAEYCLSIQDSNPTDFPLGRYILEGSKPGASASSVYFSNKIIPLNSDGYGGLLQDLIEKTQNFYQALLNANSSRDEFSKSLEIVPVTMPQSNLICFYVKPKSMKSLLEINNFNMKLICDFFPHSTNHIQDFNYFVSKTKLKKDKLAESGVKKIFSNLNVDTDSLFLVRIVLLNRWSHLPSGNGCDYLTDFLNQIKKQSMEMINENRSL